MAYLIWFQCLLPLPVTQLKIVGFLDALSCPSFWLSLPRRRKTPHRFFHGPWGVFQPSKLSVVRMSITKSFKLMAFLWVRHFTLQKKGHWHHGKRSDARGPASFFHGRKLHGFSLGLFHPTYRRILSEFITDFWAHRVKPLSRVTTGWSMIGSINS